MISESVEHVTQTALHKYFESSLLKIPQLYEKIENHLAYGLEVSQDEFATVNRIASKLPLFFINFDREHYFHMDWDRSHESLAPQGWDACSKDFYWFIPRSEIYWRVEEYDFWKLKYI